MKHDHLFRALEQVKLDYPCPVERCSFAFRLTHDYLLARPSFSREAAEKLKARLKEFLRKAEDLCASSAE